MRLQAIASGSNGNCVYLGSGETHLLIDAGISCKRILCGLCDLSVDPNALSGILVTHEHSDHISGLPIFAKKYHIPIYGTEGTLSGIAESDLKGEIDPELYRVIEPLNAFSVGDFRVLPIPTPHDAASPVGYRFECAEGNFAVATDIGHITDTLVENLSELNGILIESNHDIRMLETGSYPYPLKRRILGDLGHLSNENSGKLLSQILNENLRFIVLCHLSEENNYPELALLSVVNEINASDTPYTADDFRIEVATRNAPSSVFTV